MLDRKVALVTGGSRGIGRAICIELARLGYTIVINYRVNLGAAEETQRLIEADGGQAEICQGDVTVRAHQDLVVEYTMEHLGRIDLLANNAGVAPKVRADILETSEESFDRVLNANLRGPYFMTQRVANEMINLIQRKAIPNAHIVNISSLRAYTVNRSYGEYCISKAGVSMITQLFAVRLAEYGIWVNEICPGIIETDMTSTETAKAFYNAKLAEGMCPINRWGKPEDVGRAVGAIARGDFPFTTGGVFHVDGGWHIREL